MATRRIGNGAATPKPGGRPRRCGCGRLWAGLDRRKRQTLNFKVEFARFARISSLSVWRLPSGHLAHSFSRSVVVGGVLFTNHVSATKSYAACVTMGMSRLPPCIQIQPM